MIKSFHTLSGLPGQSELPILHYSGDAKKLVQEGIVVQLEDERGVWIGNFDSNSQPRRLLPILTSQGTAFIFGDRFCYVMRQRTLEKENVVDGFASWTFAQSVRLENSEWILCASKGGMIMIFDSRGAEKNRYYFDCCEDLKIAVTGNAVRGEYYEFNLRQWIPFQFSLPDLGVL